MERPAGCSMEIYAIMMKCWEADPADRPSFSELIEHLDLLLASVRHGEYLDCVGEPEPGPILYTQAVAPTHTYANQTLNSFLPERTTTSSAESSAVPMVTYWNNNNHSYSSAVCSYDSPPPPQRIYQNQSPIQYCDQIDSGRSTSNDDMTIDDFNERYSEHLSSTDM